MLCCPNLSLLGQCAEHKQKVHNMQTLKRRGPSQVCHSGDWGEKREAKSAHCQWAAIRLEFSECWVVFVQSLCRVQIRCVCKSMCTACGTEEERRMTGQGAEIQGCQSRLVISDREAVERLRQRRIRRQRAQEAVRWDGADGEEKKKRRRPRHTCNH